MEVHNVDEPQPKRYKSVQLQGFVNDGVDAKRLNICSPITSLTELWSFIQSTPSWVDQIIELKSRSPVVVQNVPADCHVDRKKFTPKLRLDGSLVPRTLVCHDYKGGYLEDKYVEPVNIGNGYTFYHWSQIDIFVYFSHHLITIPPLCWINAAHRNGVKILGTFITEWGNGKRICEQILENETSMKKFATALIDICILLRIDGWLLNIENKLDDTTMLKAFVNYLTQELHKKRPGSLIIWYDSVTTSGDLIWQNELNDLNRCYFDACDGIFLNYTWNEQNMLKTMQAAGHRALDVYVGLDVFGRNSYGGGKFNAHLAAKKIREFNFSMAIFAQGWTHETLMTDPKETFLERFLNRDNAFWKSLWPYLYTHPITSLFNTFFYIGVDKDWYKLDQQQQQLSRLLHPRFLHSEYAKVPTLLDDCNCFEVYMNDEYSSCLISRKKLQVHVPYVHHLFSCDITVNGKIIVYTYIKTIEDIIADGDLSLILLTQNSSGGFREITCHSVAKNGALLNNFSVCEVNPSTQEDVIDMVKHNEVPNDWIQRCYLLELPHCKILEIGAVIENGNSTCLCGIGIIKHATYLP